MIAIPSCNHIVWPITTLATMLPIIVAVMCCQDSGQLLQEATSKRGYVHRRIQGGLGGTCPPRAFEIDFFFDEYFCWCTCFAKLAYRFMNIAGDERMCGKYLSRASESGGFLETWYEKILLLPPPPPLNRDDFWRSRKISATTPPPQSVVVPLLDYPLRIRPWRCLSICCLDKWVGYPLPPTYCSTEGYIPVMLFWTSLKFNDCNSHLHRQQCAVSETLNSRRQQVINLYIYRYRVLQ